MKSFLAAEDELNRDTQLMIRQIHRNPQLQDALQQYQAKQGAGRGLPPAPQQGMQQQVQQRQMLQKRSGQQQMLQRQQQQQQQQQQAPAQQRQQQ